ncbi:MAG: ATP-dependent zinc metalloprotease FtsH [Bacilli bacterium]|nr:ATP-dependent zinc metalloprotease FtsH [Bacilli bacterium]
MNKNVRRTITPYISLIFIMVVLYILVGFGGKSNKLSYSEFQKNLEKNKVTELSISPNKEGSIYNITGKLKSYSNGETFYVVTPLSDDTLTYINKMQKKNNFKLNISADPASSILSKIIGYIPLVAILGVLLFMLYKQLNARGSMDFGKSRAKLQEDKNKVTFKNVAGLKEEKEELEELIEFLKSPKKFTEMGARIPKGVLLVGPPGTGKTLLAKAVAGEANAPFYFISGSDFVELYVGVGASRVRDMFRQAKQTAPCLIFIDEIDAVGRQRGTGLGGGHDEREQTLNQLLTEMDGFGANEGIIIIAATNRPDVLDPALLRPGRFDRQVTVSLPDVNEREDILKVHAKNKKFSKDINLSYIAKRTVSFSGADLENLLNESALLAVRRKKKEIGMAELDEAYDRVIAGPAKTSRKYTEHEKKVVAYHEAGHAVVGIKLDGANDVQKITIIPRGDAGGYNLMLPKEETYFSTKNQLLDSISGFLGGRVAEEIKFKEITTGAHNDFEKATKIARSMVTEYGMSNLGPVQLEQSEGRVFLGRDYNKSKNFSDAIALEIDKEVRRIISEQYEVTKKIITDNIDLLELIANTLLEYETITKEQIDYLVKYGKMPTEDEIAKETQLNELRDQAKELGIKNYKKMDKAELEKEIKEKELEN